jgi:hypothetical protein
MKKITEIFDPSNLDNNSFEDELEQYDATDTEPTENFPELMTDVDESEHDFSSVFDDDIEEEEEEFSLSKPDPNATGWGFDYGTGQGKYLYQDDDDDEFGNPHGDEPPEYGFEDEDITFGDEDTFEGLDELDRFSSENTKWEESVFNNTVRLREGVLGKVGNKIQDIVDPDPYYGKNAPYKDLAHHGPATGTIRDRLNIMLNTEFRYIDNYISKGPYFIGTNDPEAIKKITKNIEKAKSLLREILPLMASVNDREHYKPEELDPEGKYAKEGRPKWFKESTIREGGHRKNMSQETVDRFVHELLLVPDSQRRQEIVDEIFEKIAEENAKAYEKSQKKLNTTEKDVKEEINE